MPSGICRDSYVANAIQTAMGNMKNMHNTDYPAHLFVFWLVRILHCLISHVPFTRLCPNRYQYRVIKLSLKDLNKLTKHLELITTTSSLGTSPAISPSLATPKGSIMDRVPAIFWQSPDWGMPSPPPHCAESRLAEQGPKRLQY